MADYSTPPDPREYRVVPSKKDLLAALASSKILVRFNWHLAVEITEVKRYGNNEFHIVGKTLDDREVTGEVHYSSRDSWAYLDIEEAAQPQAT